MIIVLMGVAGAGKTTVAKALAERLHFTYVEGDDFHSAASLEKMRAGAPLSDADREPWLQSLRKLISELLDRGEDAVLTCSALRQSYRDLLARDGVQLVYLKISPGVARERLRARKNHFFKAQLLASQFATLEEPKEGITIDGEQSVSEVIDEILRRLSLSPTPSAMDPG